MTKMGEVARGAIGKAMDAGETGARACEFSYANGVAKTQESGLARTIELRDGRGASAGG